MTKEVQRFPHSVKRPFIHIAGQTRGPIAAAAPKCLETARLPADLPANGNEKARAISNRVGLITEM